MFARMKIGRLDGEIVEMPFDAFQAAEANGTAERATDEEIKAAGIQPRVESAPQVEAELLIDYKIEPSLDGGYDVKDPGGVVLNKDRLQNFLHAKEFALKAARAARGLPEEEDPKAAKKAAVVNDRYDGMNVAELDGEMSNRGITANGTLKADKIAALKHADKVDASIAAGDFEALTIAELDVLAEKRKVDFSQVKNKADRVAALKSA